MDLNNVKAICFGYDVLETFAIQIAREKSGLGASYSWENANILKQGLEICFSDCNDDDRFVLATYEELSELYTKNEAELLLSFLSNKNLSKTDFKALISFQDFRSLVSELERQGKVSDFKHWVESNGEESNIFGTITAEGVYHEYTWYMYSNQLEIKIETGGFE